VFRFIHIADVHMGAKPDPGRVWSEKRQGELEKAFDNIINICNMREIDLLLIAGDLYDAPPTYQELKKLDAKLSRMHRTQTVIVAGASDHIGEDAAARSFEFRSNTVSYARPEYTERLLERMEPGRVDAYNILLGYGGDKTHMPFSKDTLLEKGFNYIALGRRHQPTYVVKNRMAFAGSPEPLSPKEIGKHGYIYGEVSDLGENHIVFVSASLRNYIDKTYEITPEFTASGIRSMVEQDIIDTGSQHIYSLTLNGQTSGSVEINLSELVRRFNINEVTDNTSYSYDTEELMRENRDNLAYDLFERLSDEESPVKEDTRERAKMYGLTALFASGDN